MRWMVDAMNVIGSRPDGWWNDRQAATVRLVGQLERWAAAGRHEVTLVLEKPPSAPIASHTVELAHAPAAGRDAADHEIARRVEADPYPEAIRVVTSDRRLAERVRAAGAAVEPAGAFRALLDEAGRSFP